MNGGFEPLLPVEGWESTPESPGSKPPNEGEDLFINPHMPLVGTPQQKDEISAAWEKLLIVKLGRVFFHTAEGMNPHHMLFETVILGRGLFGISWVNHPDLTRPNSPQMVVYVGNSPFNHQTFQGGERL